MSNWARIVSFLFFIAALQAFPRQIGAQQRGPSTPEERARAVAVIATMLASEAAFVIEHPEKAKDVEAIYVEGVDGALRGYEAIHKKDTSYRLPHLDDLMQKRDQGKLTDYVHATARKCK